MRSRPSLEPEAAHQRANADPDFVNVKRFGYSLRRLLERYPDESPDDLIAKAIGLEVGQVEPEYQRIVLEMRRFMKVGPQEEDDGDQ